MKALMGLTLQGWLHCQLDRYCRALVRLRFGTDPNSISIYVNRCELFLCLTPARIEPEISLSTTKNAINHTKKEQNEHAFNYIWGVGCQGPHIWAFYGLSG